MQGNTTVLQGNFTRNKPKCNPTQHNTIAQQEDFTGKLGGTSVTQCNTAVLEGNFTRNKPKCNTTQQNSVTRRYQGNTQKEQRCNAM